MGRAGSFQLIPLHTFWRLEIQGGTMRRGRKGFARRDEYRRTCQKRRGNNGALYSIDVLESRILLSGLRQVAEIIPADPPSTVSKPQAAVSLPATSGLPTLTATLSGQGTNGT